MGDCKGTEVTIEGAPGPGPLLGGDRLTPDGMLRLGPISEVAGPNVGGLF